MFAILVTQLPFLVTLWYSLQSWNLVRPGSRQFVGLSNYVDVFTDPVFRQAALNTIVITASCVLVALVIGLGLAILLDRKFVGPEHRPHPADHAVPGDAGGRRAAVGHVDVRPDRSAS